MYFPVDVIYCLHILEIKRDLMDYNTLLDLATDLGYELAMSGAETFRVEESINRVLASYGIVSAFVHVALYDQL